MGILMDLFWTGFAYGAFQSYARACYAELIPKGEEARWYALFAVTDKVCSYIHFSFLSGGLTCRSFYPPQSSSFLGPLIVGLISDATGNIRYAFFFLVFMVWLAVPVLLSVDIERGRADARNYHADRGLGDEVNEF